MEIGTRVEIPAWFGAWMQGDRYGEIVKITAKGSRAHILLDKSSRTILAQVNALRIIASPRETLENAVFGGPK